MGCVSSLPKDAAFLKEQPLPQRTLVPQCAYGPGTFDGPALKVTVPAYRGRSTKVQVKEDTGFVVPPRRGIDHRPADTVVIKALANGTDTIFNLQARPSLYTVDFYKYMLSGKVSLTEMRKRQDADLDAEVASPFYNKDGGLAGALVPVPHNKSDFQVRMNTPSAYTRSYIAYSTAPYVEGQAPTTVPGIDVEAVYPWAKLSARIEMSPDYPLIKTLDVFMATSSGFDANLALELKISYPAFPDDSALIGSPEKFRVLNRAKEGVAIGRVKNAAPDNLVWHEISVAQGADASLIGLAASTVSLLRDRADFEAESAMGGERLAGGAGAG